MAPSRGPTPPRRLYVSTTLERGSPACPVLATLRELSCFPPHRLSNHFKQKTRLTVRLRAAGGTLQRPGCPAPLLPLVAPEAQATGGPAAPAGSLSRKDGCTSDPCLPPTTAKGKDRRTTEPAGTGREESPGLPMAGPSSARHPAASGPSWRGKFTRSARQRLSGPRPRPGAWPRTRLSWPAPSDPVSVPLPGPRLSPVPARPIPLRAPRAQTPSSKQRGLRGPSSTWASGGVVPRGDGVAGWVPNGASSARPGRPPGSRPPQGPLEAARAIAATAPGPAVTWPRCPNNAAVPGGPPPRAPLGPLPAGQVDLDDQILGAAGLRVFTGLAGQGGRAESWFLHNWVVPSFIHSEIQ